MNLIHFLHKYDLKPSLVYFNENYNEILYILSSEVTSTTSEVTSTTSEVTSTTSEVTSTESTFVTTDFTTESTAVTGSGKT